MYIICTISPYLFRHSSVPINFSISPFQIFTIIPKFCRKDTQKKHKIGNPFPFNHLDPVVRMKVIVRKMYTRRMERRRKKNRESKRNNKCAEMKMNINSRTNAMRKRDTESKISMKCKIKWTETNMRMKRRTNIMRKRETQMNINMKRRMKLLIKIKTERNRMKIKK